MAHVDLPLVQGWTGRIEYQLKSDNVSQALTTADSVAPWIFDKNEAVVATSSGQVDVITASCGHVGWNPASTATLTAAGAPYTMRFRVSDGLGKTVFYPNDDPVRIGVRSV